MDSPTRVRAVLLRSTAVHKNLPRLLAVLLLGVVLVLLDGAVPWRLQQMAGLEALREELWEELQAWHVVHEEELVAADAAIEEERRLLEERATELARLEQELPSFQAKTERARFVLERVPEEGRRQARGELEALEGEIAAREAALQRLYSGVHQAEERRDELLTTRRSLEERLERLERGAPLRNLPILGTFLPPIQVRKIQPPGLERAGTPGVPRVDRCITCHVDLDPELDVEGRHPRPELFGPAESPHPFADLGCTVCHGGEGRALSFEGAGHPGAVFPESSDRSSGPSAMLPMAVAEASCASCHGAAALPEAPVVTRGRRLGRQLGCAGCHSDLRRPEEEPPKAPSLEYLAAKVQEPWLRFWLASPRTVHPEARMPHFFDLEGVAPGRREVEIQALEAALERHSVGDTYPSPPPGNVERGGQLFATLGCTACHRAAADGPSVPPGPVLADLGGKLNPGWLYAWLLNPRALDPHTTMPDFHLTEDEAADLTAHLLDGATSEPSAFGEEPPQELVEALVLEALERENSLRESAARLESMDETERLVYLGETILEERGCGGCHRLPPSLAAESPAVPLPPRSAADLLARGFHGPGSEVVYALDEDEHTALVAWMMSFRGDVPTSWKVSGDAVLTAGERLLERYGCTTCHGPSAAELFETPPPSLKDEGRRVRPSWLLDYLADPGAQTLRPWLEVRMPDFHLESEEIDTLVRYFVERDGGPLFEHAPTPVPPVDEVVGEVFFGLLQCELCHAGGDAGGVTVTHPAPAYQQAKDRLHPEWVEAWILSPDPEIPIPTVTAPPGETSFLLGSLDNPLFAPQRTRLLRAVGGERALAEYLEDPERLAAALRAHVWSLGEDSGLR